MRIPKRLPYEMIIVAGLLLGSCSGDGKALRSHDEIEEIADDVAIDAIADSTRIDELESRIAEIEGRLNM